MLLNRKGFAVIAVLVLLAGAYLDSGNVVADPVGCDHKCRHRTDHRACDSGRCWQLLYPSCIICTAAPGFNTSCVASDNSIWKNCAEPVLGSKENLVYYYDSCDPACSCVTNALVEATNLQGRNPVPVGTTLYTCQPNPTPGGG